MKWSFLALKIMFFVGYKMTLMQKKKFWKLYFQRNRILETLKILLPVVVKYGRGQMWRKSRHLCIMHACKSLQKVYASVFIDWKPRLFLLGKRLARCLSTTRLVAYWKWSGKRVWSQCCGYPRRAWAATGIVVCWSIDTINYMDMKRP